MTYLRKSDFASALKHFQAALKVYQEIGDKRKISIIYTNVAVAYRNLGNLSESMKNHLESLRINEELGDKERIPHSYLNISALFGYQGNFEEALRYSLAALDGFREIGSRDNMALAYNNIALNYTNLNKYQEALDNFSQAIKINEELGNKEALAGNYNNISTAYGSVANWEDSYKSAMKCVEIMKELGGEKKRLPEYNINAGTALSKLAEMEENREKADKMYDEALQHFSGELEFYKAGGNKQKIKNAYKGLSDVYYKLGKYQQSLENYKLFVSYNDSIFNEQGLKQTEQLRVQYETEKKDKELELKESKLKQKQALLLASKLEAEKRKNDFILLNTSNEVRELQLTEAERKLAQQQAEAKAKAAEFEVVKKDSELQEQQLSKQKLIRNGLIFGTLLLMVAGVFVYRTIQLRRRLEKQQAVAEERRRISADLHDEIGSALSSINILSGIAGDKMETDREKARDIIHRINSDAKRTHESMYDIIWEVKPENDSLEKVVTRMRQYASEILEAKNIHLRFPRNDELKTTEIDPVKRHAMYLVFKESINNIAKYSGASEAEVSLTRSNGSLRLSVKDNGKGFDMKTCNQGNGISNMKQRSKVIGADFDLNSIPGKGTSISLGLPIP
jgi:signal transduction histidine kinase